MTSLGNSVLIFNNTSVGVLGLLATALRISKSLLEANSANNFGGVAEFVAASMRLTIAR